MIKGLPLIVILLLAFLGIADAWYLTQSALSDTPLQCDIGGLEGCNAVAQSPYAHLFGQPLALYGVVFFGIIFVLAALALWRPTRAVSRTLSMFAVIGVLASLAFIGIQVFLIKALCVYCILSALIAFLICGIAYLFRSQTREPVIQEWEVTRVVS
jgi:uncharacterized membrane protein